MSKYRNCEQESEGSVTRWLGQAKSGDANAITDLSSRYFTQLMEVAKSKFGNCSRTVADEEDIANSVLDTLFRNAANGRFPNLHDRRDLWYLLLAITNQKVISQKRANYRQKRGGGFVFTMTDLCGELRNEFELSLKTAPSHETVSILSDLCNNLLSRIRDPISRQIAILKLRGLSNREIAGELNLIPRTVDRKVNIIREKWISEFVLESEDSHPSSAFPNAPSPNSSVVRQKTSEIPSFPKNIRAK